MIPGIPACPLCGQTLILKEKHKTKMKYALKCSNCGARTDWYDWLCDASIAWNRRAVEDILHKRIAELEQYHNFQFEQYRKFELGNKDSWPPQQGYYFWRFDFRNRKEVADLMNYGKIVYEMQYWNGEPSFSIREYGTHWFPLPNPNNIEI